MKRLSSLLLMVVLLAGFQVPAAHATMMSFSESETMPTVWLEEMTWPEVQNALRFGYTNVLIPTAGINQNGPHMPLNARRLIVRKTADDLARRLGNTVIAPIVDFAPQGSIESREGHMRFPGTVSMPGKVFADVLDYTVRSLHKQGFTQFFIIGEGTGNQQVQEQIAKASTQRQIAVFHIGDYYATSAQEEYLRKQGFDSAAIGGHAGLRETSELMAVAPGMVRDYQLGVIPQDGMFQYGAWGNTSKASAELGSILLKIKTDAAAAQICREAQARPGNCIR